MEDFQAKSIKANEYISEYVFTNHFNNLMREFDYILQDKESADKMLREITNIVGDKGEILPICLIFHRLLVYYIGGVAENISKAEGKNFKEALEKVLTTWSELLLIKDNVRI